MKELKANYVYGSAAPAYEESWALPTEAEKRRDKKQRRLSTRNARRRAHKRALRAARIRVFFLSVGIIAISGLLFFSVYLQNMVNSTRANISSLEDKIAVINTENAAALSRIETAVNLEYVKNRAVNDLGMVYAGSKHIVYYEMSGTDFMIKFK